MTAEAALYNSRRHCTLAILVCLAFAIQPICASSPESWIPARWQGGPLELHHRAQEKTLPSDPAQRETILQWYDPSTLDLLKGSPINCLLVTWSAGGDTETEQQQQKLVGAYSLEAKKRGLALLGLIHPGCPPSSFVGPAVEAGLAGLVVEGDFPGIDRFLAEVRQALRSRNSAALVFPLTAREKLTPPLEVFATTDAVAPSLREFTTGVEATPSSEPWIDSNIWLVRSMLARNGIRPVWLGEKLSTNAAPIDYLRAIADAGAGGGRWILALSDTLRHGLRHHEPEAMATWRRIAAYLNFQKEHADWSEYSPFAVLGFVQDQAGPEREVSSENLNLTCRQRIPLRVIERAKLSAIALEGLGAVHGIDMIPPSDQERSILSAFAENGGTVVAGPSWKRVDIPKGQDFTILPSGKGKVVVYREEWPEPGSLAKDLIDIIGRDNLGVRLFRASSVLTRTATDKAGNHILVHLLNYTSYPAESVLIRLTGDFRAARFFAPESALQDLEVEKSEGYIEVTIPSLQVYGVVLVEK